MRAFSTTLRAQRVEPVVAIVLGHAAATRVDHRRPGDRERLVDVLRATDRATRCESTALIRRASGTVTPVSASSLGAELRRQPLLSRDGLRSMAPARGSDFPAGFRTVPPCSCERALPVSPTTTTVTSAPRRNRQVMDEREDDQSALGLLQDDPDSTAGVARAAARRSTSDPGMSPDELAKLLEAARRRHEARREYDAVARLLEIELAGGAGHPARARAPGRARARPRRRADRRRGAAVAYERLLALRPGGHRRRRGARAQRRQARQVARLLDAVRAGGAGRGDAAFRSSLLVSAAEVVYRYGRSDGRATKSKEPVRADCLAPARGARLDPKNRRAEMLLERLLRDEGVGRPRARRSSSFASEATQKDEKIAGLLRLARVFAKKLKSADRAAAAYERVLDVRPATPRRRASCRSLHGARDVGPPRGALRGAALDGRAARQGRGVRGRRSRSRWCTGGCAAGPTRRSRSSSGCASSSPAHPGMLDVLPRVVRRRAARARASRPS